MQAESKRMKNKLSDMKYALFFMDFCVLQCSAVADIYIMYRTCTYALLKENVCIVRT